MASENHGPPTTLQYLHDLSADAAATYVAAIGRIDDACLQLQLREVMADHQRHVADLRPHLGRHGSAGGPHANDHRLLWAGKVMVAQVVGDDAVVRALAGLEEEGNLAYEQALGDDALAPEALAVVQRHFLDERRHRHRLARLLQPPPSGEQLGQAAPFGQAQPLCEATLSGEVGVFTPLHRTH